VSRRAPALTLHDGGAGPDAAVIESGTRLSESLLWRLQRRYFDAHGPAAWSSGEVPHYITNNPFLAAADADVVAAFLRDVAPRRRRRGGAGARCLVVELGSGSGRFAHQFLTQLRRRAGRAPLAEQRVRMVMTDYADATIERWRSHPWLRPLVEEGVLDFARLDLLDPADWARLAAAHPADAVIVIANYVFDSIPADLFYAGGGELAEGRLTVSGPRRGRAVETSLDVERLTVRCLAGAAVAEPYADAALSAVVRGYAAHPEPAWIALPVAAARVISAVSAWPGAPALVLAADRGACREDDLRAAAPALALHGSFSLPVNFHALSEYARRLGGCALHPPHRPRHLVVAAYLLGGHGCPETSAAYEQSVVDGGPDDFFVLKKALEPGYAAMSIEQLLAFLRLSRWDSNVFLGCFPRLLDALGSATEPERRELRLAVERVWARYFPIGERDDLPFALGMVLFGLGEYGRALEHFGRSVELCGANASTSYNMAACHVALGDGAAARACLDEALRLDPTSAAARGLLATLPGGAGRRAATRRARRSRARPSARRRRTAGSGRPRSRA
jgi:tetratricopeptide (TPR) repeat protein